MTLRTIIVALLVVAAGFGAAPAAGFVSSGDAQVAAANSSANVSFGASVSSFMQASAADTEGEVDQGMFAASFNDSNESDRPEVVSERIDELEERLETLREERAELLDGTEGGNLTVAERAKAARLNARIGALEESINGTAVAAERAGLNTTRLDELRTNASQLSGPEVAAIATGLVDTEAPEDRGEADERGNETAGNQSDDADANRTDGGADERPGNTSDGSGDDYPDDSGNDGGADGDGSDTGSDGSNGDQADGRNEG